MSTIEAMRPALVLVLGVGLDAALGDPWHWPHPVQVMGGFIQQGSRFGLHWTSSPLGQRLWGGVLALILILGSGGITAFTILWVSRWSELAGIGLETIWVASCLAERSLRDAAKDVLEPLQQSDLPVARQRLARYVGRDTDRLDTSAVLRAVVETVSENATDGVLAPFFYAALGALLGVGSVPLAMAYKAASTLDSMVGYRRAPYTYLGWFSARLEDGLTWLPCRLVVGTLALLSRRPVHLWRLCYRDARADPSPNAGWSECAYAAALGIQLGGWNHYQGQRTFKPYLGDAQHPITTATVHRALRLTRWSLYLWVGAMVLMLGLRAVTLT
ncbi:MAG: adenosylcobinamide-phosphate synthase CbiB [Cyanobacteria bacterium J06626_23]